MNKKYLTIKEAASYLGVTPLTLRNWDKSGKFAPGRHPISNYRLYKVEELEKLLKEIDDGDTSRIRLRKSPKSKIKKLKVKVLEDD